MAERCLVPAPSVRVSVRRMAGDFVLRLPEAKPVCQFSDPAPPVQPLQYALLDIIQVGRMNSGPELKRQRNHMLELGTTAPDFTAPQGSGGQFTLSDCRGSNVVLYFFLKAFTRG